MKLLEGKTALITGAARGIGKALALRFAAEGANIAFTDLVIHENGKATEEEIAALGVKAKGYASNAADFNQTKEVVAEVVKDFGRIDILVNNAGITKDGLMMRMTEQQWDAVIAVNLKSAFNFINAVLPSCCASVQALSSIWHQLSAFTAMQASLTMQPLKQVLSLLQKVSLRKLDLAASAQTLSLPASSKLQ